MSATSYNLSKRSQEAVIQPISYYRLNGNVEDVKGVNNGLSNNITYTTGVLGGANQAIQLANNAFVDLQSNTIVGGREEFSIVILFKSGGGTSNNTLYGSWTSPQKILIRIHTGGALQFYVHNGSTQKGGGTGLSVNDQNWHVAIFTYGAAGGLRTYLDKTLGVTNQTSIGALSTGGQNEAIGRFSTLYGDHTIDVLGIYPNAFNQEEADWATDTLMAGQDLI